MSLAPGASVAFTVKVVIPADALVNATDAVTVTATSQGDNQVKDIVVLTTKCTDLVPMIYLPALLRFP